MCAASALLSAARPCWRNQYCMTMAMLAAPQASFSCFMKGTSSQTAEGWAESAVGTMIPRISNPKIVSFQRVFRPQALKRGITYGAGWHDWKSCPFQAGPKQDLSAVHEAYETLAHRDDDQDERCNTQDDQQNVAIIQISCSKIRLCLLSARGQLRQFGIAQGRDGILHLSGIHVRGLQSLRGSIRRKELPDAGQLLLPNLRGR